MIKISKKDYELLLKVNEKNINKNIRKVNNGYPIQYLIGNVNFFGYEIKVNKHVLIPRFETEQLVEETLKLLSKEASLKILDLGTGSGCISIALKKELPKSEITAIDKYLKALNVARKNAILNNTIINFTHQNMNKKVMGYFDLIISNPPYISKQDSIMPSVKKFEPRGALFAKKNGLYFYELILNLYKDSLNKNGIMAFEIGCNQNKAILEMIKKTMPTAEVISKKDYSGKDRLIFVINK